MSKPTDRAAHLATPSKTDKGRPVSAPRPPAQASTGSHISEGIRANLGGLNSELANGIRTVADNKMPRTRDPR